jgi:DNA uptake protein ComE-like DNA-binding protein
MSTGQLAAWHDSEQNDAVRTGTKVAAMAVLWAASSGAAWALGAHGGSRAATKTAASAPEPAPADRTDINHASLAELEKVPGLTPTWANRIVGNRQDLVDNGIVTREVYDRIKAFVIAHHNK